MRTNLLTLPFLALLFLAFAAAAFSALKDMQWVAYIMIGLSVASLAYWIMSDIEGFRRVFTRKGAKYGASSGLSILLALLVITGVGFLTNRVRFNKSHDVTRDRLNTLSDQSHKIIEKLKNEKKEVEVEGYFENDQQKDKFRDLLRMYEEAGLPAKVTYINPKTDPARVKKENLIAGATVLLKMGLQTTKLTTFTEEKFTNGLVNVTKGKNKKIYFTKGHGESDISSTDGLGYSSLVESLKGNRLAVEAVSLAEVTEIPVDADMIVIAGPKYDFRDTEIAMLKKFTEAGKPMLVMMDALTNAPLLADYLKDYGIKFDNNILTLRPDDQLAELMGQFNAIVTDYDKFNPVTRDFAQKAAINLILPNARSIEEVADNKHKMKVELVGKTAKPILAITGMETSKDLEALAGKDVAQDRIKNGPFGVFAVATGRVSGPYLAANDPTLNQKPDVPPAPDAKNPGKELRMVAVGSSAFVNNSAAQRPENADMFVNIANYLLQDEDFIAIHPRDATKSTLDVTTPGSQFSLLIISYLYPFLFLCGGIIYWNKRRRA